MWDHKCQIPDILELKFENAIVIFEISAGEFV